MEEKKQRNYEKERKRDNEIVRRYTVRIPKYQSEVFEEKATKEGLKPSKLITQLSIEAIDKYLKKSKRN
jgi:hypothetical protein